MGVRGFRLPRPNPLTPDPSPPEYRGRGEEERSTVMGMESEGIKPSRASMKPLTWKLIICLVPLAIAALIVGRAFNNYWNGQAPPTNTGTTKVTTTYQTAMVPGCGPRP